MKRFLSMLAAGALGATMTIAAFNYTGNQNKHTTNLATDIAQVGMSNTTSRTMMNTGPDFTVAAEKALQVVVEIDAIESEQLAQSRKRQNRSSDDPMARMLEQFGLGGDDFFSFGFPQRPKEGSGSGVIISSDGYIVTNNHVIDFADEVMIKTYDGKKFKATIVGKDPSTDLAVIKIDAKNLPVLEYANSDQVKIGEWVLAVGNPYRYLTSTVTAGIVSAVGRDIDIIQGDKTIESFIQTDAAINPGNSGGALVDAYGRLIGINTAIASQTGNYSGYSFAIPSNLMLKTVRDIKENGGDIERTNLGVGVVELDAEYAKELGLDIAEGIYIDEVMSGGAAEFAGILPTDVIVEIDGEKITKFEDLKKVIDYAKVGDVIKVKVYRNGEHKVIPVRLKKRI